MTETLSYDDFLRAMTARALEIMRREAPARVLLGIVGPPGVGKSTLADDLMRECARALGDETLVDLMPMDGYHMTNEQLFEFGLHAIKGQPRTFDVGNFLAHLRAVARGDAVSIRLFDRVTDDVVFDGKTIPESARLVFVEGNYLLSDLPGWRAVRGYLNASLYLDADKSVLYDRLVTRHLARGETPQTVDAKIQGTDWHNVEIIVATKIRADCVYVQESEALRFRKV